MHTYLKSIAVGGITVLMLSAATTAFAQATLPNVQTEGRFQKADTQPALLMASTTNKHRRTFETFRYDRQPLAGIGSTTHAIQIRERIQQFKKYHYERKSTSTESIVRRATSTPRQMYESRVQEHIVQMRERVQRHIRAIQSRVKQQLVKRLIERFNNLNEVWTNHFSKLLDRYGTILQKIQDRSDAEASNGKNVTAVNAAIQSAQTIIVDAHTAIAAQKIKVYTLDIPSVSSPSSVSATSTLVGQKRIMQGFRAAFEILHNQLFGDLSALRLGSMVEVRGAVRNALHVLETGNDSATSTPANSSAVPTS